MAEEAKKVEEKVEQKLYLIDENLAQAIGDYLSKGTYSEVAGLLHGLSSMKSVTLGSKEGEEK